MAGRGSFIEADPERLEQAGAKRPAGKLLLMAMMLTLSAPR